LTRLGRWFGACAHGPAFDVHLATLGILMAFCLDAITVMLFRRFAIA
jgi:hypothetical protein